MERTTDLPDITPRRPEPDFIRVEPGALDGVPVIEMMRFMRRHGVEMINRDNQLVLRQVEDQRC